MKFEMWSVGHFLYILSSFVIFLIIYFLVKNKSKKVIQDHFLFDSFFDFSSYLTDFKENKLKVEFVLILKLCTMFVILLPVILLNYKR